MQYRALGATDCLISQVAFGCAAMGGYDYGLVNDAESIAAVHRALDLGINFFDTADVYGLGHAEEVLALALGARRRDVVIATKFGVALDENGKTRRDSTPAHTRRAIESSLRRLRLDTIPLLQLHWPDGSTPLADTMVELVRCQDEGKIRYIGCCNLTLAGVAEMQQVGRVESIQLPLSLMDRKSLSTFAACETDHGMSGLTYSSLAHGALSGRKQDPARLTATDLRARSAADWERVRAEAELWAPRLERIGARQGHTPAQVAIQWVLEQPGVTSAIAGAKRTSQIEELAGASDGRLDPDALKDLEGAPGPSVSP